MIQVGAWFVTNDPNYGYGIHMSRTHSKRFMIRNHAEAVKMRIKSYLKDNDKGGRGKIFPLVDPSLPVKLVKVNVYRRK